MDEIKKILRRLEGGDLDEKGIDALADQIEKSAGEVDEPWKKTVLTLMSDAVRKHGPDGIEKAKDLMERLMAGEKVELDFTSLRIASDALAHLQNQEAAQKSRRQDFLAKATRAFKIAYGIIKSVV